MIYFLYDTSGHYEGCTDQPEQFPELNHTTTEPPEFDDFTETLYYVNDAWEKRSL